MKQNAYKLYLIHDTKLVKGEFREGILPSTDRRGHTESWDRFTSIVEHDVHGYPTFAYKINIEIENRETYNYSNIRTVMDRSLYSTMVC